MTQTCKKNLTELKGGKISNQNEKYKLNLWQILERNFFNVYNKNFHSLCFPTDTIIKFSSDK